MPTLAETRAELAAAKARYLEIANGPADEARAAADEVKRLKAAFAEAIVEGATPCPDCGSMPHGIEQPRRDGIGVEYEVGCLPCGPFRHADGTIRMHFARGGLLPRHAVEAWNAGPDHWALALDSKIGFVVESPAFNERGEQCATFRVYVATEERAKEIAGAAPGHEYKPILLREMPEAAAANMLQSMM